MLNTDDRLEVKRMIIDSIEACIKGERKRLANKLREFVDNQIANSASTDIPQNIERLAKFIETEDK